MIIVFLWNGFILWFGVLFFELDIIYIFEYYREYLYIKKMGDFDVEIVVIMYIVVWLLYWGCVVNNVLVLWFCCND